MGYNLEFGWLYDALGAITRGAGMTIFLIAVTTLFGTVLSVLGAAARRSKYRLLRQAVTAYVELVRNTPFLVQLFFIFFGLPAIGIRLDPILAAILAMTLNMAAYSTEIVGSGLDAVPKGQREAALALGLRPRQVFVKIVLPQALKIIFPALSSQIVIMMLESAVVSQIAVRELTYEADMLQARTFRAFETYFIVTLVYLGMAVALRKILFLGRQALFPGGCLMVEFTLWDILRNLLLAARWTIMLSAVAFIGGAIVGIAILLLEDIEAEMGAALCQRLHFAVPGHTASDAAVPDVLRPADARLSHRALDRRGARPDLLRQRLSRRNLARRRRSVAERPMGRRCKPRAPLCPGAQADHPAAGLCHYAGADRRLPRAAGQEHGAGLDHRFRGADAYRQRHQQRDLRAVHSLRPRRADLLRPVLSLDPLRTGAGAARRLSALNGFCLEIM